MFRNNVSANRITSKQSLTTTTTTSSTTASVNPDDTILVNEINNAGILTLNRPKALNALNTEMVK